jgi:hypothetical protein
MTPVGFGSGPAAAAIVAKSVALAVGPDGPGEKVKTLFGDSAIGGPVAPGDDGARKGTLDMLVSLSLRDEELLVGIVGISWKRGNDCICSSRGVSMVNMGVRPVDPLIMVCSDAPLLRPEVCECSWLPATGA